MSIPLGRRHSTILQTIAAVFCLFGFETRCFAGESPLSGQARKSNSLSIAKYNSARRSAVFQGNSSEEMLTSIASTFRYGVKRHQGISVLRNNLSAGDEGYRVPDEVYERIRATPLTPTLSSLSTLLTLSPLQVSSLVEQHPYCSLLLPNSKGRKQIELYAGLPGNVRRTLDRGYQVRLSSFPAATRGIWRGKLRATFPALQVARDSILQIQKDGKGWQYLSVLSKR